MNNEHKIILARNVIFEDVLQCIKKNWWEYYQDTNEEYNCHNNGIIVFGKKGNNELKGVYPMLLENNAMSLSNTVEYFEDLDKIFKDNEYLDL